MKEYLSQQLQAVLAQLDGVPTDFVAEFETPANPDHGDLSSNVAMQLARHLRKAPRQIADDIAARLIELPLDKTKVTAVEIAGAGFINFRFANTYLQDGLSAILAAGSDYGKSNVGAGKRAMVEYVSANPTGPLTVGHGRNAVLGDTVANLLSWTGYEVSREYYYNDAGLQMRMLGNSVRARYRALVNPDEPMREIEGPAGTPIKVPECFPETGYLGGYIEDIAKGLVDEHGDSLYNVDDVDIYKKAAEAYIFPDIESTLERLGIKMDSFFNEHTLYTSNAIWDTLDRLKEKGFVYESEGAVWFKTTELGKEKDTVLVKSSGEPTYRLPDIAYHVNKLERGFDLLIDVFGADHIATYPDVLSGVEILGFDPSVIDVIIYQFVTLVRGGQPVKMSTRKATYETLDDLMDEVGEDVTRFFFMMRSPNTHLEFDLDLAKEASDKNPVFYLQYVHARICAILRKAEEVGFSFGADTDLSLLVHEAEQSLMKVLFLFPEVVQDAASLREPHKLTTYLREVAAAFNQFYQNCRIIGEEQELATARMALATATRTVIKNGLTVLGLSAPEKM